MRGREVFRHASPVLEGLSLMMSRVPRRLRLAFLRGLRPVGGMLGLGFRYALIDRLVQSCGKNVSIHQDVWLFGIIGLSIGNNVSIHPMSYIDATGGIVIGDDVSIAHGVTIMSTSHTFSETSMPIKDQPVHQNRTVIEDDVWIGAKATIVSGIVVGKGSIVGAGAVVTHDVPPGSVVAGVPARVVSRRG